MLLGQNAQRLYTHPKFKLELGVFEAINIDSTGYIRTCSSFQAAAGISPGKHSWKIAKRFDKKRLMLSISRKNHQIEEYRRRLRLAQMEEEERLREIEGLTYGAGEF